MRLIEVTPLDYDATLLVACAWVAILTVLSAVLALLVTRGWPAPGRHVQRDPMPPTGSLARRLGGWDGDDRLAGPVVAAPASPPPGGHDIPWLVVDSPPGARGTLPTPDLGVPVVRRWSCSLCRDGGDVIGDSCIWCGIPHPRRASVTA